MEKAERDQIREECGNGHETPWAPHVVIQLMDWGESLEAQLAALTEKKAKSVIASEAGRELKRLEKLHDRYERDRNKLLDALDPEVAACVGLLLNETRVSVSVVPGSVRASTLPAPPPDESPGETIERELAEKEAAEPGIPREPREPAPPREKVEKSEADVKRDRSRARDRANVLENFPNEK